MATFTARHYATGQPVTVTSKDGHIQSLQPAKEGEMSWVAPAFFDLQINGCDGHSFNSERLTVENTRHVVEVCRRHGISGLLPTLVTNSNSALAHGLTTIRRARECDPPLARAIPGIHLEGPYISSEDGPRGAHPREHVRPPDWNEFERLQEASGGLIRLVTLAPETAGALPFIEKLAARGIVIAIGHSAAPSAIIRDAVRAGARLSTHLGNGSHAVLPRHDNYFFEQLAADDLWASMITDGHHLPPGLVKCIVRAKTPSRLILTSDASPFAGLPPGRYREWGHEFEVLAEGKIVVPGTPFLAGAWAFTDLCVSNVMKFAGLSLQEAVDLASSQPRTLLSLPSVRLEPGQPADLILFDWQSGGDLTICKTIVAGN